MGLERLALGGDGSLQTGGCLPALGRQRSRGFVVLRVGGLRSGLEGGEALGTRVEEGKVGGVTAGERIEPIDRDVVLARRRAQREQALLDSFELARIVLGGGERRIEMSACLIEGDERGIERSRRRPGQPLSPGGPAAQPAQASR